MSLGSPDRASHSFLDLSIPHEFIGYVFNLCLTYGSVGLFNFSQFWLNLIGADGSGNISAGHADSLEDSRAGYGLVKLGNGEPAFWNDFQFGPFFADASWLTGLADHVVQLTNQNVKVDKLGLEDFGGFLDAVGFVSRNDGWFIFFMAHLD